MADIAVLHHSVPRSYLKRWATTDGRLWTYHLLVPHEDVPKWQLHWLRSTAAQEHLYSSVLDPDGPDAMERWLNLDIEQPALEALEKITSDIALSNREWSRVLAYLIALDQRTPANYEEQQARWQKTVPGILSETLARVKADLAKQAKKGKPVLRPATTPRTMPVRVDVLPNQPGGQTLLRATLTPGRELWLFSMRHALTSTIKKIEQVGLRWSVVTPAEGTQWFTSDHPLLRLNYNSDSDYNFGGGWGNPGSEIIVPVSPRHVLYTQVRRRHPPRFTLNVEGTILFQRMLAERAFRAIYASGPMPRVEWWRRRAVDLKAYRREARQREEWHARQTNAEFEEPPPLIDGSGE